MLLSQKGFDEKNRQLEDLRKQLIELQKYKGQVAIHSGDAWHDNNDFEQTEIEERRLIAFIRSLEQEIEDCELISDENEIGSVGLDSTVKLELFFEEDDTEIITVVLKDVSSKTSQTVATLNSPMGKAIFQKKVGEEGFYSSPGGKIKFKILDIS